MVFTFHTKLAVKICWFLELITKFVSLLAPSLKEIEQSRNLGLKVKGDDSTLTQQNRPPKIPLKEVDRDGAGRRQPWW